MRIAAKFDDVLYAMFVQWLLFALNRPLFDSARDAEAGPGRRSLCTNDGGSLFGDHWQGMIA